MSETRKVHDPFLDKVVEVSNRLVDRLRGRYANGPTLESGEPEFGWREFQTPPIQHEAAAEIERLRDALKRIEDLAPKQESSHYKWGAAFAIATNTLHRGLALSQAQSDGAA